MSLKSIIAVLVVAHVEGAFGAAPEPVSPGSDERIMAFPWPETPPCDSLEFVFVMGSQLSLVDRQARRTRVVDGLVVSADRATEWTHAAVGRAHVPPMLAGMCANGDVGWIWNCDTEEAACHLDVKYRVRLKTPFGRQFTHARRWSSGRIPPSAAPELAPVLIAEGRAVVRGTCPHVPCAASMVALDDVFAPFERIRWRRVGATAWGPRDPGYDPIRDEWLVHLIDETSQRTAEVRCVPSDPPRAVCQIALFDAGRRVGSYKAAGDQEVGGPNGEYVWVDEEIIAMDGRATRLTLPAPPVKPAGDAPR